MRLLASIGVLLFGALAPPESSAQDRGAAQRDSAAAATGALDSVATRAEAPLSLATGYEQLRARYRSFQPLDGAAPQGGTPALSLGGLVVDETQTRLGRNFYQLFYQDWEAPEGAVNFSVAVRERPSPGRGTVVSVRVNNETAFRARLKPRQSQIERAAQTAVRYAAQRLRRSAGNSSSFAQRRRTPPRTASQAEGAQEESPQSDDTQPGDAQPEGEARLLQESSAPPQESQPSEASPAAVAEAPEGEEPAPGASAPGVLRVKARPAGATVQLNGQRVGRAPLRITEVPAGTHTLTLRASGHEPQTRRVTVRAADDAPTTTVVEAALAARTGTLSVLVQPWGTIYVDGKLRRRESDVRLVTRLPAGRHRVAVEHPHLGRWEKTVRVQTGEKRVVTVDLRERAGGDSAAATQ